MTCRDMVNLSTSVLAKQGKESRSAGTPGLQLGPGELGGGEVGELNQGDSATC